MKNIESDDGMSVVFELEDGDIEEMDEEFLGEFARMVEWQTQRT